jgi:hypothetical protein
LSGGFDPDVFTVPEAVPAVRRLCANAGPGVGDRQVAPVAAPASLVRINNKEDKKNEDQQ